MGLPKRKGAGRKHVLDLNREDSPSRPTWQNKYQQILTSDSQTQNGSTTTTKKNALSGLVGTYNSDSDEEDNMDSRVEDFLKEIQSIAPSEVTPAPPRPPPQLQHHPSTSSYPASITSWQQCIDDHSGFPYFWNVETNEVTWEMPIELKTALSEFAMKQQEEKKKRTMPTKEKPKNAINQKPSKRYPWDNSDSEDEKIEMITSFGPDSGEEEDEDVEKVKIDTKNKKNVTVKVKTKEKIEKKKEVGPQFGPTLPDQNSFETSSLFAHVVDDGPPGADSSSQIIQEIEEDKKIESDNDSGSDELLQTLRQKAKILQKMGGEIPGELQSILESCDTEVTQEQESIDEPRQSPEPGPKVDQSCENAVEVKQSTPFALIKGYASDSEEESSQKIPPKSLFPIDNFVTTTPPKSVFPIETVAEAVVESTQPEEAPVKPGLLDTSLPDSTTMHKAFKRKKRIEFESTKDVISNQEQKPGPSTASKISDSYVCLPSTSSGIYNTDSDSKERRGFGFPKVEDVDVKKNKASGIQFVKAETINLQPTAAENNLQHKTSTTAKKVPPPSNKVIQDTSKLLHDKLSFLIGDTKASAILQMLIQLETLVSAWEKGALTPTYLYRWLTDTNNDLAGHEKAAAPAGWICCWDRKNGRYFYKNTITKVVQWDYPEPDVVVAGDEMDLCTTPPPPPEEDTRVPTPPPPNISNNETPSSPVPPPPPVISKTDTKGKKKRKGEEVSSTSEVKKNSSTTEPSLPPLPPMPPPPPSEPPPLPPEPDQPFPPLPGLDQPLPPGVDEPEYANYRRASPVPVTAPPPPPPPDSSYMEPTPEMMNYYHAMTQMVSSTNQIYLQQYNQSVVESPPASKKAKVSLTSELDSFYSDIAKFDVPVPPPDSLVPSSSTSISQKPVEQVADTTKKKKKTKLAPGLSMKKKKVSSLVAKWQQVQQEVRKDLEDEDEDDDDVSSTHR